ncbi:MAG TPA: UdgX family uracil-DNA binding protein [Planctomycetota bacterium]|nr:UdgX family uracil-DNA binding protein [Planctomycetota bacterium]
MRRVSLDIPSKARALLRAVPTEDCPMRAKATERSAKLFIPEKPSLPKLRKAASGCTGCDLYKRATQTIFGEGPPKATVMFVGEQPGDQEDQSGKPFVGPAGKLLDKAMVEAGIPRNEVYVTNAVKHFKWEPRGKRRLHAKPSAREVGACRPWLEAEIAVVKPKMIICLGATAAQALMGPAFKVTKERGKVLQTQWAPALLATLHPSSIFRHPDPAEREKAYASLVEDLKLAAKALQAF